MNYNSHLPKVKIAWRNAELLLAGQQLKSAFKYHRGITQFVDFSRVKMDASIGDTVVRKRQPTGNCTLSSTTMY